MIGNRFDVACPSCGEVRPLGPSDICDSCVAEKAEINADTWPHAARNPEAVKVVADALAQVVTPWSIENCLPDMALVAVEILAQCGRLLTEQDTGFEARDEWGIQHFDGPVEAVAVKPKRIVSPHIHVWRRDVRTWPNSAVWIGPWEKVER